MEWKRPGPIILSHKITDGLKRQGYRIDGLSNFNIDFPCNDIVKLRLEYNLKPQDLAALGIEAANQYRDCIDPEFRKSMSIFKDE